MSESDEMAIPESEPGAAARHQKRAHHTRVLVVAFLAMLLVAGSLAYCQYWLWRPLGEGPAGPKIPRDAFARPWSTRPVLLVGLGDSITAGFGVPESHSYLGRLVENPKDEWPDMKDLCLGKVLPNLRVLNLAASGSTSLSLADKLGERLQRQDRDVLGIVVMTTGGNDLIHDYGRDLIRNPPREGAMYGATLQKAMPWIEAFQKRLDRILTLIEERFPGGCHIFLGDIYDPTDGIGDAASAGLPNWPDGLKILDGYNEIIHTCASRRANVHAVPIRAAFLGHGTHCAQFWREHYRSEDPTYWYGTNLEDPNVRGYDAIRRLFLLEMIKAAESIFAAPARSARDRAEK
jgi:lysophospholipase L1-like esterase